MVGGKVIEVSEVKGRPDVLYVDVADHAGGTRAKVQTCAIFVEKTEDALKIEIGDSLWWQGRLAMWTPQANRVANTGHLKCGLDYDIQISRVGYSGVTHPARHVGEC